LTKPLGTWMLVQFQSNLNICPLVVSEGEH
jgi:hypothetical protein